jgi:hypothetical protein
MSLFNRDSPLALSDLPKLVLLAAGVIVLAAFALGWALKGCL